MKILISLLTYFYFFSEVRLVDRPDAVSKFFRDSNIVDKHNQSRQFDLALEKKWVTNNPYFCLIPLLLELLSQIHG